MKKNILLSLVALVGLGSTAMADPFYNSAPAAYHEVPQTYSGPYIGAAFGLTNVNDEYDDGRNFESTDIDYNALMLQAGYEINPYIAFEFRYWFSVSDGDYDLYTNNPYPPVSGSYQDFNAWGIYAKPMFPVTPDFSIYALLGLSGTQIDGQTNWNFDLVDDTSFSWGFGASYNVTQNIGLFVDYVSLYDDTFYDSYWDPYGYYYDPLGTSVYTINFGLTYKF